MKTKITLYLATIVTAALFASCAWMDVAECRGFDQCLAYAYGIHTGVQESAAVAVDFGDISSVQSRNMMVIADRARAMLDTAKTLSDAGDVPAAERQLALSREILTSLQEYLRRRDE
jgi:hypothetical protein